MRIARELHKEPFTEKQRISDEIGSEWEKKGPSLVFFKLSIDFSVRPECEKQHEF